MGKKILLPLLASLTVAAAVFVPAVAASISQRDENAESSLNISVLQRRDAFSYVGGKLLNYFDVSSAPVDAVCILDVTMHYGELFAYDAQQEWFYSDNGWCFDYDDDIGTWAALILNGSVTGYSLLLNDLVLTIEEPVVGTGDLTGFSCVRFANESVPAWLDETDFFHLALVKSDSVAIYQASKNIVPSISSGLPFVTNAAQALVGGFDAMALDNGALTNVMAFSFTLLGLGCAVGICKKVFSWITGRHGM